MALDMAQFPSARTDLVCPECGAPLVLKSSRFKPFYGCSAWKDTGCKGAHGAHPDGAPMGTPANAETKRARMAAHEAFDKWWESRGMKRRDAYSVLRRSMGLTEETTHISMFTVEQCQQLCELVKAADDQG